jgi:hypothetical protein
MSKKIKLTDIILDKDNDLVNVEALVIYISKVVTGSYNYQGIRSCLEVKGLSKLVNKYLKSINKNIRVVEIDDNNPNLSEYKPVIK